MASITMRRSGEILQCVLRILSEAEEGVAARLVIAEAEKRLVLTEHEKATFPKDPSQVRFPKILRFSTIGAVKAGWMIKDNGNWSITESGNDALSSFADPEDLFREAGRLYKKWKSEQPESEQDDPTDEASDALLAAASLEEAHESARRDILDYMAEINPYRFQDLVAMLLEAMGYHMVWIAPKGKDGGLDLVAQTDPLGVSGPRIKGQVKRRPDSKVTEDELRSFISLIEQHDVGVYISLGGFTSDAQRHSRSTSRRLTLIDGNQLLELWVEHYAALDDEARQLLPLQPVYFLDRESIN